MNMVPMTSLDYFPDEIRKDLRADRRGRIYTSRKALGRILGVQTTQITQFVGGYKVEPEEAELIDLPDFGGVTKWLTESQVRKTAKYFAYKARKCTDEAERFYDLIAAIGWRSLGQQLLGWTEADQMLALIEKHYPAIPESWRKVYSIQFFDEIKRIYGYVHGTPQMGKFINAYVYACFPDFQERLDKINPRKENGRRTRINTVHLSDEAKRRLERHLDVILVLLKSSNSPNEFEELHSRNFENKYQLALF